MAKLSAAHQRMDHTSKWAGQTVDSVDPARWTKKIEAALGKPEELEALRVTYDEKALTAMSTWLSEQRIWRNICDGNAAICDAIRDVLAAYDAISPGSADQWIKPIMQSRCVEAVELHRTEVGRNHVDDRGSLFTRAYDILVAAFTNLEKELSPRGMQSSYGAYTTDLVVQGSKYEKFLNRDVDLRHVYMVEFVDCVNSKHPASQKLAELMISLEPLVEAARLAESRLKGGQNPYDKNCSKINNGTINERQHANRLLDALHGQPSCIPTEKQVEEQDERRRLYEGVRQEVLIAHKALRAHYEELVKTLHASVAETQQLLGEIQGDRCTTVDRWETVRICMNNCLAVDLRLRSLGRELQNLLNVYSKDLSQGAGLQTIAERFAEVEARYRPFKPLTTPTEKSAE